MAGVAFLLGAARALSLGDRRSIAGVMSESLIASALLLAMATPVAWAQAPAPSVPSDVGQAHERRVALLIGNSAYREGPLDNPVNDARAMAQTLSRLGFVVTLKENANLAQIQLAVREFGDELRKGGVGLFYYAGHGVQLDGRNYLIPVDADIARDDEIRFKSMDASQVLEKMDTAGNGMNIMILDACRNNPFARSYRSRQMGLAQMDAPAGTIIAFATSPGAVAMDGRAGTHGVYTQHLLHAMAQPGLKIEDVFKKVRARVRNATKGTQIPWENTSLEGDFYFLPSNSHAKAPATIVEAKAQESITSAAPQDQGNAAASAAGDDHSARIDAPGEHFSFSRSDARIAAQQAEHQTAIRKRFRTPCSEAAMATPLLIAIEQSRSGGMFAGQDATRSNVAMIVAQRLRDAGLTAVVAAPRREPGSTRSAESDAAQPHYSVTGEAREYAGFNDRVQLKEVSLRLHLALSDREQMLFQGSNFSSAYSGNDVESALFALSQDQALDLVSQMYEAYCLQFTSERSANHRRF